jgi:hypothetical protein
MASVTLNERDKKELEELRIMLVKVEGSIPSEIDAVRTALKWAKERICSECNSVRKFEPCGHKKADF